MPSNLLKSLIFILINGEDGGGVRRQGYEILIFRIAPILAHYILGELLRGGGSGLICK